MARLTNPYIVGMPLTSEAGFYGREDVFRFVREALASSEGNVIVLVGGRRMGKTSVLHQLPPRLPEGFHSFYFDLEGKASLGLNEVLHDLARAVSGSLGIPAPQKSTFNSEHFRDRFLPRARQALGKQCLLLLFDEFDVPDDEPLTEDSALRTLYPYLGRLSADEQGLALVFAAGRRVQELPSHFQSLFESASIRILSPLTPEDAARLVTEPVQGVLEYDENAIDRIFSLTAGHPYLSQVVCYELFEHLRGEGRKRVTVADVEAVIEGAIKRGQDGLAWIWEGWPKAERIILSAVAHITAEGKAASKERIKDVLQGHSIRLVGLELTSALDVLLAWGALEADETGDYRWAGELVGRWIATRHPLKEEIQRIDTVSLRASRSYFRAREAHLAGHLEKAIEGYRQALAANPNHSGARNDERAQERLAAALISQGEAHLAARRFDEALDVYEQLLRMRPEDKELKTKVAEIKARKKAREAWVRPRPGKLGRKEALIWMALALGLLVVGWFFYTFTRGGEAIAVRPLQMASVPSPMTTPSPTLPPVPTPTPTAILSTDTPTPPPTDTPTPPPTDTPTPLPTDTPTPPPTDTPSPTAAPTKVIIPTDTPTSTPTATDTPSPSPTATPTPPYPAPRLISPKNESRFSGEGTSIELRWEPVGLLAEAEWYGVSLRYRHYGQEQDAGAWVKEPKWLVPRELAGQADEPDRVYEWDVVVVRHVGTNPDGSNKGLELSPRSPTWIFYWR